MARFDPTVVHEVVDRLELLARYMPPVYAFAGAVTGFTVGVVFSGGSLAFGIVGATAVAGAGFAVAVEKTLRIRLETQVAMALAERHPCEGGEAARVEAEHLPSPASSTLDAPPPTVVQERYERMSFGPTSIALDPAPAASTFPCLSCGGPILSGRTICPACSTDNSRREGCAHCGALRQSPTQRACRKCGRPWD